jgi:hypothetical protein
MTAPLEHRPEPLIAPAATNEPDPSAGTPGLLARLAGWISALTEKKTVQNG